MAATRPIIDSEALLTDLRLCSEYASRAGLLLDRTATDALEVAEEAAREGQAIDVHVLMAALNEVTRVIAPMTVADLTFGRTPFSWENQRRVRFAQLGLSVIAVLALFQIGCFMHALQVEQRAIASVTEVQALRPELKLTALRNIAQHDDPTVNRTTVYQNFHEKINELRQINTTLSMTYADALHASTLPLFPFGNLFGEQLATTPQPGSAAGYGAPVGNVPAVATTASLVPATSEAAPDLCAQDEGGALRLPGNAVGYPKWIQTVLEDTFSDICFQVKVLSPGGEGALLNGQAIGQLAFVSAIKDRVSLRVTWWLPFFYGCLGALIFLTRDVANVRTPWMGWLWIAMRVVLGGVAGIIIGWFASGSSLALESTSMLSVPFALAFLTGYGIDVLFTVLDRLNRAIADVPKPKQ